MVAIDELEYKIVITEGDGDEVVVGHFATADGLGYAVPGDVVAAEGPTITLTEGLLSRHQFALWVEKTVGDAINRPGDFSIVLHDPNGAIRWTLSGAQARAVQYDPESDVDGYSGVAWLSFGVAG